MLADRAQQIVPAEIVPSGINRKYLRLSDLRRLQHLFFSGRKVVEGQYSGRHATPQRGQSVEFRDYRQYMPGDEIGSVDWKVFGRSDKLFIKVFEHQADMTVNLLVDASSSMAYRGDGPLSKYDQACYLSAAVAFLIVKQQDRVSFGLAQNGLHRFQRPNRTMPHLAAMLACMEETAPQGKAGLAAAIRDVTGQSKRRDLLIVFSDLLDDADGIRRSLAACLHSGREVILFHVLHADELELPHLDNGLFIDSETAATLRLNVADVRPAYQARLKEFLEGWVRLCRGHGIDYNRVSTSEAYIRPLEQYLFSRAATV